MSSIKWIKNGTITTPKGFLASGIEAGIKAKKKDMALVASDEDAVVAGTFTTNQIKAGCVRVSMKYAGNGAVRGVIMNSGNANACNGVRGLKDARRMADYAAEVQGFKAGKFLVCSTGRIGVPLPMDVVEKGIVKAANKLSYDGGKVAAEAIMTTDTFAKTCAVSLKIDGHTVTIGAMAKGAGMIHPNMATMLCVVTTDAAIDKKTLKKCTEEAVEYSFNRISVDGDTSTNDTVLVFANGKAENNPLRSYHQDLPQFQAALSLVMKKLAGMIVEDGEGISRIVELNIVGAANSQDAKICAEAICRSPLVKTSWCGGDPNWGRLISTIGHTKAKVREELVEIYYDGVIAVRGGVASSTPFAKLHKIVAKRYFTININLNLGKGTYTLLTNDLTEDYVTLNKGE